MNVICRYIPVFLLILLSTGCSDPVGDFRMEQTDFTYPVAQLLVYQQELDNRLSDVKDKPGFVSFLAGRAVTRATYSAEINALNRHPGVELTDLAQADMLRLQNISGPEYYKLLLRLIVDADQELIGLHVKASGPAGLKDNDMRNWAGNKLSGLIAQLDASQQIWKSL